jgi:hypothetical protein
MSRILISIGVILAVTLFFAAFVSLVLVFCWQLIVLAMLRLEFPSWALVAVGMAAFFLSWAVALMLHELGHLIAALAVRSRVCEISFGVVRVTRLAQGFRLRWNSASNPSMFGVASMPWHVAAYPLGSEHLRFRWTAFMAGGILANLLLAGIAIAVAQALNPPSPPGLSAGQPAEEDGGASRLRSLAVFRPNSLPVVLLNFFSLANLLCALLTLFPVQGRTTSDGAHLLRLARGGKPVELFLTTCNLVRDSLSGTRSRDLDTASIDRLLALRDGTQGDFVANLFATSHAADSGDAERSRELLNLCFRHPAWTNAMNARDPIAMVLLLARAIIAARHQGDAEHARLYFMLASGTARKYSTHFTAEAEILLAESAFADARRVALQGLAHLDESPDLGGAILSREHLVRIRDEAAAREATPST